MKNDITYIRKGDYLHPNLTITPSETRPMGKYGLLRKSYLKEHKPDWYRSMLLTGELDTHLADIEEAAQVRHKLIQRFLKFCTNFSRGELPDNENASTLPVRFLLSRNL